MQRSTSFNIMKPYKEKDGGWKPKKGNGADMGSYEVLKPMTVTKERHPAYGFPRCKSVKFTVEYSNNKKHIPSASHYKVEKCINYIHRPYMRKR
mmetsp:Transcript_34193/g.33396  ORF Transcript_34193/g.33396 Transcript_34193/m.33396 type:complete len:94 (-) Transcript_34193:38-319(-)